MASLPMAGKPVHAEEDKLYRFGLSRLLMPLLSI